MTPLEPVSVSLADLQVIPKEDTPLGMTIARVLTHGDHGSQIMVGVSWMKPGEVSNRWSAEKDRPEEPMHFVGEVHEFFFLVRGRLLVEWGEGSLTMGPMDTVFLPPGRRYQVTNVADEEAFLLYAETPPLG